MFIHALTLLKSVSKFRIQCPLSFWERGRGWTAKNLVFIAAFIYLGFVPHQGFAGCPNGAAVLPALGNAQGIVISRFPFVSAQRANRSLGRTIGPLGRHLVTSFSIPLGVAQGLENGRAFGPTIAATSGTKLSS
jgi:hypothetical protein